MEKAFWDAGGILGNEVRKLVSWQVSKLVSWRAISLPEV